MTKRQYMGIDQYGQHYHALTHPRQELLSRLGRSHADKMYVDGKDGKSKHAGYVIGGLWITLYQVIPFQETRQ